MNQVKELLSRSEYDCEGLARERKEASDQVVKLSEMKAMLQQQLEDCSNGSVAEKQVRQPSWQSSRAMYTICKDIIWLDAFRNTN